jgi:hypothetical protein
MYPKFMKKLYIEGGVLLAINKCKSGERQRLVSSAGYALSAVVAIA